MNKKFNAIIIITGLIFGLIVIFTRQIPPDTVLNFLYPGNTEDYQVSTNFSEKKTLSKKQISPYLDYLRTYSLKPTDYVVKKFQEKDLIIISENHWLKSHTKFVEELIPSLVKSGIRDFAFEFGNIQSQKLIDDFLEKPEPDMNLLYETLSEAYDLFGWPFKGYVNIFLRLHEENKKLKQNGEHLYIHLVDAPLRVKTLRSGWYRDEHMAKEISKLLNQKKKVLFYCGASHGITNLTSKKNKKRFPLVGSILKNSFKDRVFSIKLHHFAYRVVNHRFEIVPFAKGLFDQVLQSYGKASGFDLKGSPFEDISANYTNDTFLENAIKENKLSDAWEGYIFTENSNKPEFCGIQKEMFTKGYINKKNFKDSFILSSISWLFFSNQQLIDACTFYKLKNMGLTFNN